MRYKYPSEWKISLLDDVTDRGSGHTPSQSNSEYWNGGIKWVSLADSSKLDNLFIANTDKEISVLGLKNSSAVKHPAGTVILSRDAGIGKSAILKEEMAVSQHFIVWRCLPKEIIYNVYLYYWLQLMKPEFERMAVGSTIKTIGLPYFKKLKIAYPPIKEQRKIVEILNTWDKAIALLEQLITAKRKLKQGLMQQLLTGKKRFKEFGLPIFSEEYLPNKWNKVALREVVTKEKYSFTGGPFGSNLKAEHYTDEGIRIIQLQNIGDGKFNDKYKIFTTKEKADELISCNIYPGDIIISKMGDPVARACFVPDSEPRFLMASDGIRLKVDKSKFDPIFLLEQINSPIFRKIAISHSTGSTRQRIGLDVLRELPILVPPIEEQKKLAFVFSTITKEILNLEKQLVAYKQQKRGLMQQLLTGKKRVKIDEPQMQKV